MSLSTQRKAKENGDWRRRSASAGCSAAHSAIEKRRAPKNVGTVSLHQFDLFGRETCASDGGLFWTEEDKISEKTQATMDGRRVEGSAGDSF